jgi:hypothetical protein
MTDAGKITHLLLRHCPQRRLALHFRPPCNSWSP